MVVDFNPPASAGHDQNKDQYLDQGGANEVSAANAKDAVSKKHTQNTDTSLDSGGSNPVTAEEARLAAVYRRVRDELLGRGKGDLWLEAGTDALSTAMGQPGCVVYRGLIWLIGGMDGGGTVRQKVLYSPDGVNWSEAGSDVLPEAIYDTIALNFKGKMWILGGKTSSGNTSTNKILSSKNGQTWTEEGTLPVSLRSSAGCVYDGKMWFASGLQDNAQGTKVYSSPDGVNWTEVGDLPAVRYAHRLHSFKGKMWLTGGSDSGGTASRKVYYSSDGVTWTEAGTDVLPVGGRTNHYGFVYNNKLWVLGGQDTGGIVRTAFYSLDGATWSEAGTNALGLRAAHTGCVFDGKMWVFAGYNAEWSLCAKATFSPNAVQGGIDVLDDEGTKVGAIGNDGKIAGASLTTAAGASESSVTDIKDAVDKKHTRNADWQLGSGLVELAEDLTTDSVVSGLQYTDVKVISEDVIYVVYTKDTGAGTMFIKSVDGGYTWSTPVEIIAGGTYPKIDYADANTLYAVALVGFNDAVFVKSTDGGDSWSDEVTVCSKSQLKSCGGPRISVVDANNVYIMAAEYTGDLYVYHTSNGGTNWTPIVADNAWLAMSLLDIKAISTNVIFCAWSEANTGKGLITITTNAGVNWTTTEVDATATVIDGAFDALDASNLFYLSRHAYENNDIWLYKSSNGGTNWTPSQIGTLEADATTKATCGIWAQDANNIHAALYDKDNKHFYYAVTANGGTNWTLTNKDSSGNVGRGCRIHGYSATSVFATYNDYGNKLLKILGFFRVGKLKVVAVTDASSNESTPSDLKDAVDTKHTQGTDQKLDEGGGNEVSVADVKDAVDKKHASLNTKYNSVADNTAFTVTIANRAMVAITVNSEDYFWGMCKPNTIVEFQSSANFDVDNTQGTLSGETGVDGHCTVRMNNSTLYIENRLGGTNNFGVSILGEAG